MVSTLKKRIVLVLLFLGSLAFAQETRTLAPPYLRDLAVRDNFLIGCASTRGDLNNPRFREVAAREFDSLSVENDLKCTSVSGPNGAYYFNAADYIIKWAEEHGMKIRGHTLVWHNSVPKWLAESGWNKEQVLGYLKEYITTVVGRYKGRLYCWDVVNEIFGDDGRLRDGRTSFWYKTCGDEYIEQAFRWAHEADPDAKLFINDYGVETVNPKSTGLYELVKKLLAKGVPVQGFGMQCHVAEDNPPDFASVERNIRRFVDLGLEVQMTELDVRIRGDLTPEKLRHQSAVYSDFFRVALSFDKVTGITTWGVSDEDSWISYSFNGYGGALLFDDRFNPKPAYFAVKEILAKGRLKKK
jgi:endo-1,4-beta-xylanase